MFKNALNLPKKSQIQLKLSNKYHLTIYFFYLYIFCEIFNNAIFRSEYMNVKSNNNTAGRCHHNYNISISYYFLAYIVILAHSTYVFITTGMSIKNKILIAICKNLHNMHNSGICLSLFHDVYIEHVRITYQNSIRVFKTF